MSRYHGWLKHGAVHSGKYVDLKDTISGFKGILEGQYDDLPEMAFYMVSSQVFDRSGRLHCVASSVAALLAVL